MSLSNYICDLKFCYSIKEMEAVTEVNTQVIEVTAPTVTMKSDGRTSQFLIWHITLNSFQHSTNLI